MNYGTLLNYHTEIQSMGDSIFRHFMRSKVKEFYKHNGLKIDTLINKIKELQNEFFVMEVVDGNTHIATTGEGDDKKPVMVEGKELEKYNEKYRLLMKEPCNISL